MFFASTNLFTRLLPAFFTPLFNTGRKKITSQKGALFGLDARIALAVFGVLSVVAGATAVLSIQSVRGKSLGKELTAFAQAIESMHYDLKIDIFEALTTPSDQKAFQALYDPLILESDIRGKWIGPYITTTTSTHKDFGERIVTKRGQNYDEECSYDSTCYLWLVYAAVPKEATLEANKLFDSANEIAPDSTGRLQWVENSRTRYLVAYRISTAMGSGEN